MGQRAWRWISIIAILLVVIFLQRYTFFSHNHSVTSESGYFTLSVEPTSYVLSATSDKSPTISLSPQPTPDLPPNRGRLTVFLENIGSEDIEIDVWLEISPSIYFIESLDQAISAEGQRVTRSGIPLRPSERRILEFLFELDEKYDPGRYVMQVNANSSAEDIVTTTVNVEVK